jgi:hypothetical protein
MSSSPNFSIPKKVADIALEYGPTVSKGIQEMKRIIDTLKDGDNK